MAFTGNCQPYIQVGAMPEPVGAWDTRLAVLSLIPAALGTSRLPHFKYQVLLLDLNRASNVHFALGF